MKFKTRIIVSTMSLILVSHFVLMSVLIVMLRYYVHKITEKMSGLGNTLLSNDSVTAQDIYKFKSQFNLFMIITIAIILVVCLIITSRMTKRFLKPINLLTEGVNRINQNNLYEPIVYNRNDEFKDVCITFNNMQNHLLEESENSAKYEKARIDMIAGISHDLRTPLTSVKGYIKGISDGVANTPEKQKEYLDIAYKKACEMDAMLTRLFNISKLETGNLLIEKERFELVELVTEYTKELVSSYPNITIDVKSKRKYYIYGDVEQICEVFSNLVINAIKYSKEDNLLIAITFEKFGNSVRILFSDNGIGVDESQIDNLFKQFWRADKSRSTTNPKGSGLGLYIVKNIIEAHKGSYRAYNDNGLTIEIVLPYSEKGEV